MAENSKPAGQSSKGSVARYIKGGIMGAIIGTVGLYAVERFVANHEHEKKLDAARERGTLREAKPIGTFSSNEASVSAGLQTAASVPKGFADTFAKAYTTQRDDPKGNGPDSQSYVAVKSGATEMWAQITHHPKGGPSNLLHDTICYSVGGEVKQVFTSDPVNKKFVVSDSSDSFIKGGCDNRFGVQTGAAPAKINKINMSGPS